jgi:hypothetical protein|tara:strand:+ start:8295 stop:8450 length:156 start_codon:yes stop_codon:yes gene_type:complete
MSKIYKVTTYIRSNTDVKKWFDDTLEEYLEDDEYILETKVEPVGEVAQQST